MQDNYYYLRTEMRLSLLLSLLILSACTSTPEIPASQIQTSSNKILSNQSDAEKAKSEYKTLQEQRRIR